MQSKVNIFHSLQHASDSEEDNDAQTNKTKKIAEKREQRAHKDDTKPKQTTTKAATGVNPAVKEDHNKAKAPYKAKGVTEEAHPLDRHSGHKNQAYGEKAKKSGAGKGNWGNYKEDRKGGEEAKEAGEPGEETTEEKVEEAPEGITLAEYYQQRQSAQNEPQVNEAKAKITSEQLTKELGTATALKSKAAQQIDDKKVGRKKDRLDVNHHAAINSENANLLNFRTGFVEKEYRPRGPDDVFPGGNAPRTRGPRTGGQKEDSKQEETQPQATEGQTAEAQPTEGQTQEGTTAEVQTPTQTQGQGQGQGQNQGQDRRTNEGQGQRGGRGGYRGGNRGGDRGGDRHQGDRHQGDRHQGDRQQGDRQQGDRPQGDRPRKQQGGQEKLNFDDSAFPKLG